MRWPCGRSCELLICDLLTGIWGSSPAASAIPIVAAFIIDLQVHLSQTPILFTTLGAGDTLPLVANKLHPLADYPMAFGSARTKHQVLLAVARGQSGSLRSMVRWNS